MENNEIEDFFNNPAGFMRHSMNPAEPESEFMQEYQQEKTESSASLTVGRIYLSDGSPVYDYKDVQVALQAREHEKNQNAQDYETMVRIIEQAAKVRKLQKDYFESVKKGNKDYEILQQSKVAEKELDVLLEEYNSPQERLL